MQILHSSVTYLPVRNLPVKVIIKLYSTPTNIHPRIMGIVNATMLFFRPATSTAAPPRQAPIIQPICTDLIQDITQTIVKWLQEIIEPVFLPMERKAKGQSPVE